MPPCSSKHPQYNANPKFKEKAVNSARRTPIGVFRELRFDGLPSFNAIHADIPESSSKVHVHYKRKRVELSRLMADLDPSCVSMSVILCPYAILELQNNDSCPWLTLPKTAEYGHHANVQS